MFTALENEVLRILRANLSPQIVPAGQVLNGPLDAPPGQFPTVIFTAGTFETLAAEDVSPPRGVKVRVEDIFAAGGDGTLALSKPPLEPLHAVEIEVTPGGSRLLLRERDDYTVDYVNQRVRLRSPAEGAVHVIYASLQPLRVVSATRLRVGGKLEVWADPQPEIAPQPGAIATVAAAALAANASAFDGLLSERSDVPDSGSPALGVRETFVVFEGLRLVSGAQPAASRWEIGYSVEATLVLAPKDEAVGLIRAIAAGVAWDEKVAEMMLSTPPPILDAPVTIIKGVGAATSSALRELGITTIGQLAQAAPRDQPLIDLAISRARTVQDRAEQIRHKVVQAAPAVTDISAFLSQRLVDVNVDFLTAVRIREATAREIVSDIDELLAQITGSTLKMWDLLPAG